jgi:photosystem II stability/assembly factor-like uncharacterized protein
MRRSTLLLAVLLLAVGGDARANGRFPATVSVTFQPGNDQAIWLGATFGLLHSGDDGATWTWICEQNIGYTGVYDPTYAVSPAGTLFATTPEGLRISRDEGCSFTTFGAPLVDHWIADVQVGPDGAIWVATSTTGMVNDVFVSRDDGKTFVSANLMAPRAWWKSIRIAPGDPDRVYVAGYQIEDGAIDGGNGEPDPLLWRTTDGGMSWTQAPFPTESQSQLRLLAVSPENPDVLFARFDVPPPELLYRSDDAGDNFVPVAELHDDILGTVIRPDGTVLAGSQTGAEPKLGELFISTDGGTVFTPSANPLRVACLGERVDGDLFACGANWTPDQMALGRSTDGQTWEKVVRFSELDGPKECPAGSPQQTICTPLWPGLACQLGLCPDAGPRIDASTPPPPPNGKGCGCGVSLALAFVVLPGRALRRRR